MFEATSTAVAMIRRFAGPIVTVMAIFGLRLAGLHVAWVDLALWLLAGGWAVVVFVGFLKEHGVEEIPEEPLQDGATAEVGDAVAVAPAPPPITYATEAPALTESGWRLALVVDGGGHDTAHTYRCQVFDPLGRTVGREVTGSGGTIAVAYPDGFGVEPPLPSGLHAVVWSVSSAEGDDDAGAAAFAQVARTEFTVGIRRAS